MFQRFNQLKTKWPDLQLGTLVACRTRWRRPEDLWTGREGADTAPIACGVLPRPLSLWDRHCGGFQLVVGSGVGIVMKLPS